jgi:2-dehydropantoate 2-reductase
MTIAHIDAEYLIVGAGAMGSIIGAHLARSGHAVAMLARGSRAAQLHRDGLIIKGLDDFSIQAAVVEDPAQIRSARTLIIATKAQGTAQLLTTLQHLTPAQAFSVQNGVQKNELLSATFGRGQTLGALADISGELRSDGSVLFTRNVDLLIGELSGGMSERCESIARAIAASGVRCRAVPDIVSLEWSKFVVWTGLFALSILTRAPTWRFLEDPDTAAVLVRITREMTRLAGALGVELSDQSLLPLKAISTATEAHAVEQVREAGHRYRQNAPSHRMSALQDLEAGRPLEVHDTLGYALQKAQSLNVPMDLLDACYRIVAAIDRAASPRS